METPTALPSLKRRGLLKPTSVYISLSHNIQTIRFADGLQVELRPLLKPCVRMYQSRVGSGNSFINGLQPATPLYEKFSMVSSWIYQSRWDYICDLHAFVFFCRSLRVHKQPTCKDVVGYSNLTTVDLFCPTMEYYLRRHSRFIYLNAFVTILDLERFCVLDRIVISWHRPVALSSSLSFYCLLGRHSLMRL